MLAGDLVFIPKGVIHKTNYGPEEHSRIVIECSASFIPDSVKDRFENSVYHYRNTEATEEIYGILKRIEKEQALSDEFTDEMLHSLMKMIFLSIVRNKNSISAPGLKNRTVEKVVAYIKSDYSTDITLTSMAEEYSVTPEHLSRIFKRETGFGFNEFLTLVRLQHAENMLKEERTKKVSEIAYICGFNDSNYFSDKFKRMYGISPLAFSKKMKEEQREKITSKMKG
jgi:YesN/AraC family two-component response regulator